MGSSRAGAEVEAAESEANSGNADTGAAAAAAGRALPGMTTQTFPWILLLQIDAAPLPYSAMPVNRGHEQLQTHAST